MTKYVLRHFERSVKIISGEVAETPEEAEDFLDMCMAAVCKNMKEVREYLTRPELISPV